MEYIGHQPKDRQLQRPRSENELEVLHIVLCGEQKLPVRRIGKCRGSELMRVDCLGREWSVVELQGIREAIRVVKQPERGTGPRDQRENQGVPDAQLPGLTPRQQHKQSRKGQNVPLFVAG